MAKRRSFGGLAFGLWVRALGEMSGSVGSESCARGLSEVSRRR